MTRQPGLPLAGTAEFRCLHCHHLVLTDPRLAGVQNRNHCPYCLWSRHMDLARAGDRLAACLSVMQPVGLTLKETRKRYSAPGSGELMLIHRCAACGKVSINRIAADDDADTILSVLDGSEQMVEQFPQYFSQDRIRVLQQMDHAIVRMRLFGSS
jgi:DNA-directed RNA polymerase subunit RPC12/RpoP